MPEIPQNARMITAGRMPVGVFNAMQQTVVSNRLKSVTGGKISRNRTGTRVTLGRQTNGVCPLNLIVTPEIDAGSHTGRFQLEARRGGDSITANDGTNEFAHWTPHLDGTPSDSDNDTEDRPAIQILPSISSGFQWVYLETVWMDSSPLMVLDGDPNIEIADEGEPMPDSTHLVQNIKLGKIVYDATGPRFEPVRCVPMELVRPTGGGTSSTSGGSGGTPTSGGGGSQASSASSGSAASSSSGCEGTFTVKTCNDEITLRWDETGKILNGCVDLFIYAEACKCPSSSSGCGSSSVSSASASGGSGGSGGSRSSASSASASASAASSASSASASAASSASSASSASASAASSASSASSASASAASSASGSVAGSGSSGSSSDCCETRWLEICIDDGDPGATGTPYHQLTWNASTRLWEGSKYYFYDDSATDPPGGCAGDGSGDWIIALVGGGDVVGVIVGATNGDGCDPSTATYQGWDPDTQTALPGVSFTVTTGGCPLPISGGLLDANGETIDDENGEPILPE